ncbi:NUDIX hydrolase [Robertmurraya massiliosenegalensis]|uniref:NUDIX hydrolase n=1 Tax=Robertmurraya massiliosenegalensis TaxID=1287657 RepID=UPI00031F74B6|nr:CoA pyrophosphatase [Robertmurraya massiliosenegalensis]
MDKHKLNDIFQDRKPGILGRDKYSNYAVLLPIIEKNNELHVLFEVRSYEMRRQPGEICFPGGRVDPSDPSERHTAIRETSEELGIEETSIEKVFPLDFVVNPFGSTIYPFVGFLKDATPFSINKAEVAEIFTVPLSFLQKVEPDIYHIHFKPVPEESFPYEKIVGGEKYKWQIRGMEEHFYYFEDKVIWGLTARILSHFLTLIRE